MKRKNMPRLAAAFVVTLSACGGEPVHPNPPGPETPPPKANITKNADGTCREEFDGNPPGSREVPCPDDLITPVSPSPSATPETKAP